MVTETPNVVKITFYSINSHKSMQDIFRLFISCSCTSIMCRFKGHLLDWLSACKWPAKRHFCTEPFASQIDCLSCFKIYRRRQKGINNVDKFGSSWSESNGLRLLGQIENRHSTFLSLLLLPNFMGQGVGWEIVEWLLYCNIFKDLLGTLYQYL